MPRTITERTFGIHFNDSYAGGLTLGAKVARLWDEGVTWRQIETAKGVFAWTNLDAKIARNEALGLLTYYELGQPPNWAASSSASAAYNPNPPTDNQDFLDFITALHNRYGTRIHIWGLSNEPNLGTFWNGTEAQMLAMVGPAYTLIKSLNPDALVISPSATTGAGTTWLEAYLALGGGAYCDAVGHHFYIYPNEPEYLHQNFVSLKIRRLMNQYGIGSKPLWNTEWTYNTFTDLSGVLQSTDPMPEQQAADYMVRHMALSWLTGADAMIFYGLMHNWSKIDAVTRGTGASITKAGQAFQYMTTILPPGSQLRNLQQHGGWHYSARFIQPSGARGKLFWGRDAKTMDFDLSGYARLTDSVGNALTKSAAYAVTSPVYAFD